MVIMRRLFALAIGIVLACFICACGGGEEESPTPVATAAATVTPQPTAIAAESPPAATATATLGPTGTREVAPDESIYLINPDGSDEVRLAHGLAPVWSPDGQSIAFIGGGTGPGLGGRSDIYVMNSDGTEVRKVGEYKWSDVGPECFSWAKYAWSPDSRFIVYHSMVDQRIFLARADGKEQPVEIGQGGDAGWSPDGGRIAFSSVRIPCKIYLTEPEGEWEAEELTDGKSPAWAPDGKRIAFSRRGALHVINADGTGERELPAPIGVMQQPVWSPDGSRIAVVFETTIVVVDVEDGQAIDVALGRDPTWSPDGSKIAFTVYPRPLAGWPGVYIVDADGSGEPQRLTRGEYPAWSPDGSRIAFTR